MEPSPLFESPPESDQVTGAASPLGRVAVNFSTDVPFELVVLQPVQLVSIETVPGEMLKLAFEGVAVTLPMPHPATISKAGARRKPASRRDILLSRLERTDQSLDLRTERKEPAAICASYAKVTFLFSTSEVRF